MGEGNPVIAIIGRPNVGKSTLFNRIIGRRKAITLDTPGVSRDRHYGNASWDGREFVLIDTGGIPARDTTLEKKVGEQIDVAMAEADAVLFVVDGRGGLIPEDNEILKSLRKAGKKFRVVVNKIDRPSHQETASEFYTLSENPFFVSAEHGVGIGELLDDLVLTMPTQVPAAEEKTEIRVAIIGRPNVGKSSLLNRLLGEERVVVHEEPGTTRDTIDTPLKREGKDFILLDTAGIRRRGQSNSAVERHSVLQSLKAVERCDICLVVLDTTVGVEKQDAHVAGYASEAKKGIVLLWNKWDLVKNRRGIEKETKQFTNDKLPFLTHAPVLSVSAKTGLGLDRLWPTVLSLYGACQKRVPTRQLNEVFQEMIFEHNLPVYRGRPVKFFYATQTAVSPPTIVVFTSDPKGVHFSFKRYLLNRFREKLGFGGAPIEILFRKKR